MLMLNLPGLDADKNQIRSDPELRLLKVLRRLGGCQATKTWQCISCLLKSLLCFSPHLTKNTTKVSLNNSKKKKKHLLNRLRQNIN